MSILPDPIPADESRTPASNVIDQRQQQIDPARHHTRDPNAQNDENNKQPGDTHTVAPRK